MTDYITILREIHDNPDQFALLVIASWCGKSADEIERLRQPDKNAVCVTCGRPVQVAHCVYFRNGREYQGTEAVLAENERLQARVETLEGELADLNERHTTAVDAWNREVDRNQALFVRYQPQPQSREKNDE